MIFFFCNNAEAFVHPLHTIDPQNKRVLQPQGFRPPSVKIDLHHSSGRLGVCTFSKACLVRSAVKASSSAVGASSFSLSPLFSLMLDSWEYTILSRLVPCFTIASCLICADKQESDGNPTAVQQSVGDERREKGRKGEEPKWGGGETGGNGGGVTTEVSARCLCAMRLAGGRRCAQE